MIHRVLLRVNISWAQFSVTQEIAENPDRGDTALRSQEEERYFTRGRFMGFVPGRNAEASHERCQLRNKAADPW